MYLHFDRDLNHYPDRQEGHLSLYNILVQGHNLEVVNNDINYDYYNHKISEDKIYTIDNR